MRIARDKRSADRHKNKKYRKKYNRLFYTATRVQLLEQFGWKCAECGIHRDSKHMHFHHLNYDGTYLKPDRSNYHPYSQLREVHRNPSQFKLLCISCHMRLSRNEEWTKRMKGEILTL